MRDHLEMAYTFPIQPQITKKIVPIMEAVRFKVLQTQPQSHSGAAPQYGSNKANHRPF